MENHLIIDSRETQLSSKCLEKNVIHEIKQLICGDILAQIGQHQICIERKTVQDFWSSIKDGRYREQRARLLDWMAESECNHVIYLIEGVLNDAILISTIHRLFLVYNMHYWRTQNIDESADYIIMLYNSKTLFNARTQDMDKMENLSNAMKCKKDFLTSKNILVSMIQSLHGFSHEMAVAITKNFNSIYEFINNLESMEEEIVYETRTRKKRKIGKNKMKQLSDYLGIPEKIINL